METIRELDIVRGLSRPVLSRADGDEAMPTMVVRFSPFGTWYEIDSWWEGRFLERTERGSFAKTMAENRANIKVLYDHGYDFQIGNKVLGPIDELVEDPDSARGDVPLLDTSYNRDLLPGLEAGLYGSSFRFRVIRDEWNDEPGIADHNPEGIPERTIKEVRLFEFGPVTFPANPDATAGLRSLTDDYYARMSQRNPERVAELRSRVARTRPTDDVDTSADRAATNPTDAPSTAHPAGLSPKERRHALYPFLDKETSS